MRNCKPHKFFLLRITGLWFVLLFISFAPAKTASAQQKIYRGSIGGSHAEMRLNFEGNKVSGSYSYDRIGEEIKLRGQTNAEGGLELTEFDAKHKPAGKINCKHKLEELFDPECVWSRVDGSHQAFVSLTEQYSGFTGGMKVVPKTIIDRTTGVIVSYPQLASEGTLTSGAEGFNQHLSGWMKKAVKDSDPQPSRGRTTLEMNYNVLLGSNDFVSIEITEYSDNGGAHPNHGSWGLTYDLNKNKELAVEDVFKPDSDYRTAIGKFVIADIQRRANAIDQEEARRAGRTVQTQDEPIVSMDQLTELAHLAITPKGVMVYFNFPNVIADFDRTLVPYAVVKDYLQPNGPATRFQ